MRKGKVIEKAVRSSGVSITLLAKKLKKSRQWVYHIFESDQVSSDVIADIGKAIHYDFSKDFKNIHFYSTQENISIVQEDTVDYWKEKYIDLLEEYNELLKKQSQKF
jgi:hypothetical protein